MIGGLARRMEWGWWSLEGAATGWTGLGRVAGWGAQTLHVRAAALWDKGTRLLLSTAGRYCPFFTSFSQSFRVVWSSVSKCSIVWDRLS